MRILYHHRTLGDGAEGIHVSSMAEAFRRLGHEVRVSALIGGRTNVTTLRTRILTGVRSCAPRGAYELMELAYSALGGRALLRAIREWQPDVLYERYTLFNYAGVTAARRGRVPIVIEVNAPLAYERAAYERLTMARLARRSERDVCSRGDLVIAVSTPLKEYLALEGIPAERILVMPNGADHEVFRPDDRARSVVRDRYGIPQEAIVIGFTGILRPWHGLELLARAFKRLAERSLDRAVYLLIVGDGPARRDIERIAGENGLSRRLRITGRVAHEQIPNHVAAFDIGVSPRATFYASPMKIPEYMAAGAAVVAPDMPNLRDLVTDEATGLLFAPESEGALADALHRLAAEPHTRERLSRAARADILERRTWCHNARSVIRALDGRAPAHASA